MAAAFPSAMHRPVTLVGGCWSAAGPARCVRLTKSSAAPAIAREWPANCDARLSRWRIAARSAGGGHPDLDDVLAAIVDQRNAVIALVDAVERGAAVGSAALHDGKLR